MKRSWSWQVKGVAVGVGTFALCFLISFSMTGLAPIIDPLLLIIIMCLTCAAVGTAFAPGVFKEEHSLSLVFLSLSTFLLLRCILVAVMFPAFQAEVENPLSRAVGVALAQIACIYLPLLAGIWLLKKTEMRFGGAEPADVEINPKSEEGTCPVCGKRTVIASHRALLFLLGMKKHYLCQHCLSFIRGNPVVSILGGISQIVIGSVVFTSFLVNITTNTSDASEEYRWFALIALGGYALGGVRQLIASCWGVFKAKRS